MKPFVPTDLGSAIATRLRAPGKVTLTPLSTLVDEFLARVGPKLLELANRGENPFQGGGFPVTVEWIARDRSGRLELVSPTQTSDRGCVSRVPSNARADQALEIMGFGLEAAALGPSSNPRDERLMAAFGVLEEEFDKHGLTFLGIGGTSATDHAPVVIYSSKLTSKVAPLF